jgi:hypothetical protein
MTIVNDSSMFDDHISYLKSEFEFDQVLFKSNNKYFILFEGLKDGEVVELRFNISDQTYEVYDGNRWV